MEKLKYNLEGVHYEFKRFEDVISKIKDCNFFEIKFFGDLDYDYEKLDFSKEEDINEFMWEIETDFNIRYRRLMECLVETRNFAEINEKLDYINKLKEIL